jgi:hypothetical protein
LKKEKKATILYIEIFMVKSEEINMSKKLLINQNGEILATQSNGVTKLYSIEESGSGNVDPISGMPIVDVAGETSSVSIQPNTYYKFNSPVSSTIQLTLMPELDEQTNEYVIEMPVENADTVITFSPTSTRL